MSRRRPPLPPRLRGRVSAKIGTLRREGDRPDVAAGKAYAMARAGRLGPRGGYRRGHRGRSRR